jgi:hypothetical protein
MIFYFLKKSAPCNTTTLQYCKIRKREYKQAVIQICYPSIFSRVTHRSIKKITHKTFNKKIALASQNESSLSAKSSCNLILKFKSGTITG